jgi:soluble lytic murein transglycosylase-like protein
MPIRPRMAALGLPGLVVLLCGCGAAWGADTTDSAPYRLKLPQHADYCLHNSAHVMTKHAVSSRMPAILSKKPYAREIEAAARASRLDPILVHALIHVESGHRQEAISNKGAIGLMQLMPATALRFGVDQPTHAKSNLRAGTRYLRMLLDLYDQRLDLTLSAYNAGEGAVARYNGMPPYAETRRYVPAVLGAYETWREKPSSPATPAYPAYSLSGDAAEHDHRTPVALRR